MGKPANPTAAMLPEAPYRERFGGPVAGIDEAGRGPWAGPVVAAAAVLTGPPPPGLDDSKRLTAKRRAAIFAALPGCARIGIGIADTGEIDRINILRAADLAMKRALEALLAQGPVAGAVIDGNRVPPGLGLPAEALVGGDGRMAAIAAASVVAKVTRDRMMAELAARHPGYGWERNMGYGTAEHRAALARLGVTPQHRRSFAPISRLLLEES
ncbi:ribonuclease HII [Paralimibaculum aggregatum]|nr:ribonuclease HII [Limibaculum sp. NKW23]